MSQSAFYFRVGIAAMGVCGSAQMVRIVWRILREARIERRPGLRPISPHDGAALYWAIVGFITLGAIIAVWGTSVLIVRLLNM